MNLEKRMCFIEEKISEIWKAVCSKEFITIFAIGLITNLGQLLYQGGNGDTNVSSIYQPDFGWECTLGRWMIQYVSKLRNNVVIPLFIEVFSIFILAITLILIFDILKIRSNLCRVIGACLFFAQPYVSFMLHIYYCADAYAFSTLFATLAAWCLIKGKLKSKYPIAIISMVVSLSLYQSNIVISAILILGWLMEQFVNTNIDFKELLKKACAWLLTGISGVFMYIVTLKMYLNYRGLSLSGYKGMSNMGKLDILKSAKKLPELLNNMYFDVDGSLVGYSYWLNGEVGIAINVVIIICIVIWMVQKVISQRKELKGLRIGVIVLCAIFMPVIWGIIVFMAPDASIHVLIMPQLTFIYMYALSAIEKIENIKKVYCRLIRWCGVALVTYVAYNYCLTTAQYQYGLSLADNKAYVVATEVNSRLENTEYWEMGMKIAVIGDVDTWSGAPEYYDIYGKSECLFWHDYGSQGCWQKYLLEKLGVYYTICTVEEYNQIISSAEFIEMESFPKQDCIKIINDIVVIKLSDVDTW